MAREYEITGGVYKIQSKIKPERVYIGSAVNIKNRWSNHLSDLRNNKHHSIKLQRHYDKYRMSDLEFCVLLECRREDLTPIGGIILPEQLYINMFKYSDSLMPYFNCSPTAGSNMGFRHSKKSKEKNSKSNMGRKSWCKGDTKETNDSIMRASVKNTGQKRSKKTKTKQSIVARRAFKKGRIHPMQGKHHTQETKDKLRNINLGKKLSQETINKMSLVRAGRKMSSKFGMAISKRMMGNQNARGFVKSPETIEKLRIASTGRVYSLESRRKMSDSHKGKKQTKEEREKKSTAMKIWWANKKEDQERKIA